MKQDVMALAEQMISAVFAEHMDVDLGEFPRMTYAEAMHRFGSDKPDMRIPLELVEIKDLLADIEFKVFAGPANDPNCRVSCAQSAGRCDYFAQANRRVHQICWRLWRQGLGVDQGQCPRGRGGRLAVANY